MQLTVKLELLQLPLLLLLLQFLRLVERRGREELKIASALAASQLLVREPPITGQHFRMLAGFLLTTTALLLLLASTSSSSGHHSANTAAVYWSLCMAACRLDYDEKT